MISSDTVVKIPAVFEAGGYSCSLPAYEMAKNMTVGLAINGIHMVSKLENNFIYSILDSFSSS